MIYKSFKMSDKSENNCDQNKAIMNRIANVEKEGFEKKSDFIGIFHYCFHQRLQGLDITGTETHVICDPGSSSWDPWPAR